MSPDLKPDSVSFPKLVSQLAQMQHGQLTGHLTLRPAALQAQAPYGTARLQVAPQTRCDLDLRLRPTPKSSHLDCIPGPSQPACTQGPLRLHSATVRLKRQI